MHETTKRLRKFINLKSSDKFIVIESFIFLTLTTIFIKLLGIRSTHSVLKKFPEIKKIKNSDEIYIKNINLLIKSASKSLPFKTKCIEEATTLWTMLKIRGIKSYLKIGISDKKRDFNAHAWVEIDGKIISNNQAVSENYLEFDYKFFTDSDKR